MRRYTHQVQYLRCAASLASAADDDERDLQRKPHDVEALQCPGGKKAPEIHREYAPTARACRENSGEKKHLFVPDHVAELGENGNPTSTRVIAPDRPRSNCAMP